ncbi:MAG: lipopolysaccharide assembly protein LapB [Gammaproteobacteria bacterium]|nr:lipopolysaccharide assembly protein LapB [Gammaproteobacteria bacterium]
MLNLLWLLLPVAFVFGWWGGRRSGGPQPSYPQPIDNESSYFRGLKYLINDQQDKAIELFVGISEVDQEMADTQLALGNLFRRRGEFDRAIRIHQNLVERTDPKTPINANALLELANDYMSSGLLDRAEELFRQLLKRKQHMETAYNELIRVFERESDWERAIQLAEESQQITGNYRRVQMGHYFCELAESALEKNDNERARDYLKKALRENPVSARANILRGNLAMERKDYQRAIECFTEVEKQSPELTPEIIEPLLTSYCELQNETALHAYIDQVRSRYNSYSVIKTTRKMIERLDGPVEADQFFKQQILKRPSLKGLRDWAQGELKNSKPGEREKVAVIIKMLDSVVEDKPGYVCTDCGFKAKTLHWRCPSCGSWDTVRTVIGAEGE